jgi:hypothetical protein
MQYSQIAGVGCLLPSSDLDAQKDTTTPTYTYLVVGSGMTANQAAHGICEVDHAGSFALLTNASTYGCVEASGR